MPSGAVGLYKSQDVSSSFIWYTPTKYCLIVVKSKLDELPQVPYHPNTYLAYLHTVELRP